MDRRQLLKVSAASALASGAVLDVAKADDALVGKEYAYHDQAKYDAVWNVLLEFPIFDPIKLVSVPGNFFVRWKQADVINYADNPTSNSPLHRNGSRVFYPPLFNILLGDGVDPVDEMRKAVQGIVDDGMLENYVGAICTPVLYVTASFDTQAIARDAKIDPNDVWGQFSAFINPYAEGEKRFELMRTLTV